MNFFGPLQFSACPDMWLQLQECGLNMVWIKWGVMHLCLLQNRKLIKIPTLFVSEVLIFVFNVDLMSWKESAFRINCRRNDVSGTWSVVCVSPTALFHCWPVQSNKAWGSDRHVWFARNHWCSYCYCNPKQFTKVCNWYYKFPWMSIWH